MSEVRIKNFKRVLVANRGEIAIRVFRALNELGITSVAIYSKEDKYAMFRTLADEAYPLNPEKGPIDAYLDIPTIIKIAKDHNIDAIHPGYGFLAENPVLVEECEKNGLVFIGPTVESMNAMGDKISSKQIAIASEVPIIPGVDHAMKTTEEAIEVARKVGYPVMLKASNGGGGRGMRIVNSEEEMAKEFKEAIDESKKAFGDDQVFIEKYLKGPKHVEVQVLADNYGNVVHLFDRDCSVQRRHQKVVEYAPAFSVPQEARQKIFDSAIRLCKTVGYRNAGTCEFLVDRDGNPYFIEMNPRIQVEHTVTELVTDVDIVRSQILIAEGYPLNSPEINISSQEAIQCHGYAIQTRVTSEDPSNNFMPDTGKVSVYHSGSGNGIRLDGGNIYTGAEILPYYDSLLVKISAFDRTFKGAAVKSLRALREMRIQGIKTNISFLINVVNNPTFQALLVHVGQGEHLAGGPIHHDGGDEALLVKLQLFHGLLVQHGFSPSQSSAHGDAVVPQGLFQVGDGNLPKVEHRGRQPRVHPGQGLEEVHKVLDLPRAPGGDHRDLHRLAHGGQHLQVKAPFDPVGVDGVDHHFPGAQVHAVADPADGLHPRVVPASPGEDPELALHPLHVGGEDHALAAVPQGGLADQVGVADGPGVYAHLVRPALEDPVKVLQGVDAAPHGEGDEHPAGGLAEDVGEQPPALGGGGDVVKHQFVGPALGVVLRQFDGGVHVVEAFKVDPLHHPAVLHVQAGDDAFGDHSCAPFPRAMACARSMAPV